MSGRRVATACFTKSCVRQPRWSDRRRHAAVGIALPTLGNRKATDSPPSVSAGQKHAPTLSHPRSGAVPLTTAAAAARAVNPDRRAALGAGHRLCGAAPAIPPSLLTRPVRPRRENAYNEWYLLAYKHSCATLFTRKPARHFRPRDVEPRSCGPAADEKLAALAAALPRIAHETRPLAYLSVRHRSGAVLGFKDSTPTRRAGVR